MAEQSESIKKAVVTLRELSEDEKIRLQCEARERYQMDWQSSMRTSREKGREEGRKEGRKEGRESGLRDGKLQNARKVTLALMEREMPLEEIAQIVEMDERIIRELAENTTYCRSGRCLYQALLLGCTRPLRHHNCCRRTGSVGRRCCRRKSWSSMIRV